MSSFGSAEFLDSDKMHFLMFFGIFYCCLGSGLNIDRFMVMEP
jgi:hypothetical protein